MQVPPRAVRIAAYPAETVFVVAEHEGHMLYWSDVDEGWELESPDEHGGISERGANQYELSHIMWQLFGDPELL
jgi:hypothetical protein